MGSEYSVEVEACDAEFLIMGGRSFAALIDFVNASDPACGSIRILHDCEYQGGDDFVPERVTFDGIVVADDASRALSALSQVDAEVRLGAFEAREWIAMFERMRTFARANPESAFRPRFCE